MATYNKFLLIGTGNFVNEIRGYISNLAIEIEIANEYHEIQPKLKKRNIDIALFDADSYQKNPKIAKNIFNILYGSGINFIVFSSKKNISAVLEARNMGASDYIIRPYNVRELILRANAILNNRKRIACIGGGSGLFNILMGIKNLPNVLPLSVVSMTDDGGSSGRIRESFGMLPPGDVRRSLVALSNAPRMMNEIMTYRFKEGTCFRGHNFGNLLLTVLNDITGSMSEGVKILSDILNIRGIVLPVSQTDSRLWAMFENGVVIKGESNIDLGKGRAPGLRIKKCWHEPVSKCDINSFSSIINADVVTIGPGDLYTSVITNLLIKDLRRAITETTAKKVYVCNIMTKPGETASFTASDHIKELIKYLGKDCLDYVIISDNSALSSQALLKYSKKKQFPVQAEDFSNIRKITRAHIIIADVAHETELIRHDSGKIAKEIAKIIK